MDDGDTDLIFDFLEDQQQILNDYHHTAHHDHWS